MQTSKSPHHPPALRARGAVSSCGFMYYAGSGACSLIRGKLRSKSTETAQEGCCEVNSCLLFCSYLRFQGSPFCLPNIQKVEMSSFVFESKVRPYGKQNCKEQARGWRSASAREFELALVCMWCPNLATHENRDNVKQRRAKEGFLPRALLLFAVAWPFCLAWVKSRAYMGRKQNFSERWIPSWLSAIAALLVHNVVIARWRLNLQERLLIFCEHWPK